MKAQEDKKEFFLNNIVDPNWKLKRDELKLIRGMLWSIMFIVLLIDFVAIFFYMKTRVRIDKINEMPFTDLVKTNNAKVQTKQQSFITKS